uniref:C2H2-type domain-containing protein n=1 Tax=Peronospora matthiolae TaxID=2874970 RepID=A0AAV1VBA2_9STRA
MNSALWSSTASVLPSSVQAVYAHAQRFMCTLCTYTASSFASLKRHRDSRHCRIAFLDRFSAGCACGTPFVSRLAAANHARAFASLRDTSAATASAAGDLSPTAGAVNATATVTDTNPCCPAKTLRCSLCPLRSRAPRLTGQDGARRSQGSWSLLALRLTSAMSPPLAELTEEEETKAGDGDDKNVTEDPDMDGTWLLHFDGACRKNPGPGGAGAALFKPSGPAVWTCSHYMPNSSETNNTADTLVIQQVRGIFATRNKRLRQLRIAVKTELARIERATLHPIDRQANGHTDRLANAALDCRRTEVECGMHNDGQGCTPTSTTAPVSAAAPPPATRMSRWALMIPRAPPMMMAWGTTMMARYEDKQEAAGELVQRLDAKLAAKITDADDWEEAEGCITALTYALYDRLQQHQQDLRPDRRQEPH